MNSVWKSYMGAGHDIASLTAPGGKYKCARCGQYMIDLSEDLVFGEMRKCVARTALATAPEEGK